MMPRSRAATTTLGLGLAVMVVAAAAILALATPAGGRALVRAAAAHLHHPITVHGPLTTRLLTRHPSIEARDVVIGNPPWMTPGTFARLASLTVRLANPLRHGIRVEAVEVRGGEIEALRHADGVANWTTAPPPRAAAGGELPPLRHLVLDGLHLRLKDEVLHLDFDGAIATMAMPDGRFGLTADGQLNGRSVGARLAGDPLAGVEPGKPWSFEMEEESSGTRLTAKGAVPEPFQLGRLAATFEARGEDLRDLRFLVGVSLPDTARYTLRGQFLREGTRIRLEDLSLATGGSDLAGSLELTPGAHGPRMTADLRSRVARLRDVGRGAAGRGGPRAEPPHLLAGWRIPVEGLRPGEGRIRYHTDTLEFGPLVLHDVSVPLRFDYGLLRADPIHARTDHGEAKGHVTFDARAAVPHATLAFDAAGIDFATLLRRQRPPPAISGPLGGTMTLDGRGASIRELFANGSGRVRFTLPSGELSSGLAQALGLNLRALGLKLSGEKDRVALRCALVDARIGRGEARIERLVIDAEPVVLSGEGSLNFDTESLDVTLQGASKRPGLRLRSPLKIAGHLMAPAPRLDGGAIGRQGVAAAALGAVVAPAAAAVAFIDPGRGRDADCGSLLAARTD